MLKYYIQGYIVGVGMSGVNAPDYSLDKYDEAVLLTDLSSTLRQSSNEIYKISNYINGWNAGATSTKQIRGAATGQASTQQHNSNCRVLMVATVAIANHILPRARYGHKHIGITG